MWFASFRSVSWLMICAVVVASLAGAPVGAGTASLESSSRGLITDAPPMRPATADTTRGATAVAVAAGQQTSAATAGYTWESPALIGESPLGMRVYVDPQASAHAPMAAAAATAVAALRPLGLAITWNGYGRPAAAEGIIAISEGPRGCSGAVNRIANTFPYLGMLPNGDTYLYRSEIVICPRLYTLQSWQWGATVTHELGHALGLDHTNYLHGGSYQLMNSVNHVGVTHYQAGDIAGLRILAGNTARVRSEVAPLGRLEDSHWNADNTITLQGWTLLSFFPNDPVTVTIRDNNAVVATTVTTLVRADVNTAQHVPAGSRHGFVVSVPWTAGTHSFCVTAISSRSPVAHAALGCVAWNS